MDLEFVRTLAMAANQMTKYVRVKVLETRKELMGLVAKIRLAEGLKGGNVVLNVAVPKHLNVLGSG